MTNPGEVIKYCLKCGNEKFIFDGNRSFLCKNCGFHFYINSSAAVAALIFNSSGQLLLTVRSNEPMKGYLDLPGGFVDPMESAEVALYREIKEELNLEVTHHQYLVSYPNEYIFSGYTVYTTDLGYLIKVKDFDNIQSNDDISGFVFVDIDAIDYSKISSLSIKQIIKFYINNYLK